MNLLATACARSAACSDVIWLCVVQVPAVARPLVLPEKPTYQPRPGEYIDIFDPPHSKASWSLFKMRGKGTGRPLSLVARCVVNVCPQGKTQLKPYMFTILNQSTQQMKYQTLNQLIIMDFQKEKAKNMLKNQNQNQ